MDDVGFTIEQTPQQLLLLERATADNAVQSKHELVVVLADCYNKQSLKLWESALPTSAVAAPRRRVHSLAPPGRCNDHVAMAG